MCVILLVEVGDPTIVLNDTIRMYVEALRAIRDKLNMCEVIVRPFARLWNVGFSDCVKPADPLCLHFDVGNFNLSKIEEMIVRWCATDSAAGMKLSFQSLWRSLRECECEEGDRVVFIGRSESIESLQLVTRDSWNHFSHLTLFKRDLYSRIYVIWYHPARSWKRAFSLFSNCRMKISKLERFRRTQAIKLLLKFAMILLRYRSVRVNTSARL